MQDQSEEVAVVERAALPEGTIRMPSEREADATTTRPGLEPAL